jgi:spore maturation protein CgeB
LTSVARIVVVGEPAEAGLRSSLVTALLCSECDVEVVDLGPWRPALVASAAFRQPVLGGGFRRQFRRQIDVLSDNRSADLVLVVKGAFLDYHTLDYLRRRFASPVVCWNPDSPFDEALSNCGAGIPRAIGAYDAYITWSHEVAERLSAASHRVLVIPFAWDPMIMRPAKGDGKAAGRIVFIGTWTKQRYATLERLAHLRPMVFGSRWPSIEGIDARPPIRSFEFAKVAGEAKWNLNLLRAQNASSHNMRTFELVGSGGNQVAPQTSDHKRFLGQDSRTVLFRNNEELEFILRSDPHERPDRLPNLLKGHTYVDRARQLLVELNIKLS